MKSTRNQVALLAALLLTTWLQAAGAESADYVRRDFVIDAVVFSYVPDEGIKGYDGHGSGMATARSSLGFQMRINNILVEAEITSRLEEGRFLVTIDLKPEGAKRSLGFEQQTLDLTDLRPTAIRLATTENGRVYQLNLTPSVQVTDNTPRRLDVSEFRLHNWQFLPNSPILVDDAI